MTVRKFIKEATKDNEKLTEISKHDFGVVYHYVMDDGKEYSIFTEYPKDGKNATNPSAISKEIEKSVAFILDTDCGYNYRSLNDEIITYGKKCTDADRSPLTKMLRAITKK